MKIRTRSTRPSSGLAFAGRRLWPVLFTAAVLAACASPQPNQRLDSARNAFEQARRNTARTASCSVGWFPLTASR